MSRSKRIINHKKRPIKVVYPYMCPFCEELAYPENEQKIKPIRLSNETIAAYRCMADHIFYVYEKVVKDQSWAESKLNDPKMRERTKNWKRQLRQHNYGVEDLEG